jgi:ribosomal protein L22
MNAPEEETPDVAPDAAPGAESSAEESSASPPKPKRRRSRAKAAADEPAAEEAAPEETPDEEVPEPKRRRRRRSKAAEETVAEEEPAVADEPVADEAEPEDEESEDEESDDEESEDEESEDEESDDEESEDDESDEEEPEGEAVEKAPKRPRVRRPVGPPTLLRRGRRSSERTGEAPVVYAKARYVRSSARKARLVCDHIRGKSVPEARAILAFAPRGVAKDWAKLLESAVANAEHNHELIGEELFVKEIYADVGPTLKRFRPRAQGRATPIHKRTSHLSIALTPKE